MTRVPQPRDGETRGFRGPEAVALSGISYRQLDYWCRTGLVEPSVRPAAGSGTQRLYSRDDVIALRLVRTLLGAGLSLQVIRSSLRRLLAEGDVASIDTCDPHVRLTVNVDAIGFDVPEPPQRTDVVAGLTLVR